MVGAAVAPPTPSPWLVRRGLLASRVTVDVAGEHGMGVAACLAGTGLAPQDLDDPDADIEPSQEFALIRNVLAHLGDPTNLGLAIGLRVNVGNLGVLGFAILASATVREAVTVGLRYLSLTPAWLTLTLTEHGDRAVITADDREIPLDLRVFFLARDLAAIGTVFPLFLGHHVAQTHLDLSMDAEPGDRLAAILPVDRVTVGAPRTTLTFPRALLDEPLPNADEHAARMCEQQCRELLQRRQSRRGYSERVRSRLLRDPGELPSMTVLAAELNMDARTLRRHLDREGTSFRRLLDEVRETMAIALLAHAGLTVEEVAKRLGYAETANFTHAFTRWTGQPPSRYRRTHSTAARAGTAAEAGNR